MIASQSHVPQVTITGMRKQHCLFWYYGNLAFVRDRSSRWPHSPVPRYIQAPYTSHQRMVVQITQRTELSC